MKIWVGVDWGQERCGIAVLTESRGGPETFFVDADTAGLAGLCARLTRRSEPTEVFIAVERATGRIVNRLVDAGFEVHCINPKQVDRGRALMGMSTAKDDIRDALVLARLLQSMPDIFTCVVPRDPLLVQLKGSSRLRQKLVQQRVAAANRANELLRESHPAMLKLVDTTSKAFIRVWRRVPSPQAARTLRPAQLKATFAKAQIRRIRPKEALKLLRTDAPAQAAGESDARTFELRLVVDQLELLHDHIDQIEKRIDQQFDALHLQELEEGSTRSSVEIARSMPGIGRRVLASLLGEGVIALLPVNLEATRGICGVAPVTRATGKRQRLNQAHTLMRRSCSTHLRGALHDWSTAAIQRDASSRERYAAFRARGHTHGRACRQLADRNLRVLRAMLTESTLYNASERPPQPS